MNNSKLIRIHDVLANTRNEVCTTSHTSIAAIIDEKPELLSQPTICTVNGEPILRADWEGYFIQPNSTIAFIHLPLGDGSDKNPLTAIVGIASLVAGTFLTGGFASLAYGVGATLTASGLGLLPKPEIPTPARNYDSALPSPTYSLSSQGNSIRLLQPIPVCYGKNVVYPDFSQTPYSDYVGDKQYLNYVLALGNGRHTIHDYRIGGTSSSQYNEVSFRQEDLTLPDNLKLFLDRMHVSQGVDGQELLGSFVTTKRLSRITDSNREFTFTFTLLEIEQFIADSDLEIYGEDTTYIEFSIEHTSTAGIVNIAINPFWYNMNSDRTNPITVTSSVPGAAGTTFGQNYPVEIRFRITRRHKIGFLNVDTTNNYTQVQNVFALPNGLYSINNNGEFGSNSVTFSVVAQMIDDSGQGTGPHITLIDSETITGDNSTPIYRQISSTLPEGKYRFMAYRQDTKNLSSRAIENLVWLQLRVRPNAPTNYGRNGIHYITARLLATNNLSQQNQRRISVSCTRALKIYNRDGSVITDPIGNPAYTATRNPVWAMLDVLTNSEYGAGVSTSKIDMAGFYDVAQILDSRSDYFDGVFDRRITVWEALRLIGQSCRCAVILQNGQFRIIRDHQQTIPTAMYTPNNIIKDSFSIRYILPNSDQHDGIQVEYIDAADNNETKTLTVDAAGSTSVSNPERIRLFGVTNQAQAMREALYLARNNNYRRKIINFSTELEGHIPTFGDLVAVGHDVVNWGQAGEVIGVEMASGSTTGADLILSNDVEFQDGASYQIALRKRDGSMVSLSVSPLTANRIRILSSGAAIITSTQATIPLIPSSQTTSPSLTVYFGGTEERTHYSIGSATRNIQNAIVKSIRPRGGTKVDMQVIIEDNRVHAN